LPSFLLNNRPFPSLTMAVYRCQYWLLKILRAETGYLRIDPNSTSLAYKSTVVVYALTVTPQK
jgi:hypothetical protein